MRVLKPRNRLVIFRLSEQEYQSLKAACASREARSVSDFARSAVLRSIETGGPAGVALELRMAALARRLNELESGVKRILRLVVCVVLACTLSAQVRPAAPAEPGGANLPAQKIGSNDLIAVSVYDSPELSRTIRVGADGTIRMPMLKRRIQAEGLLPGALEAAITTALQAESILVDPVVTVTIAEYHSRPISIAGAVRNPITFQAVGPVTLLDALTRAGGLSAEAGPEILLSRTKSGADPAPVQRIPVKGLIDAADPSLNVMLTGGEEIRVPEASRIYVVGNVRKPGAFPIQDHAGTTVLQVLALAEGLAPFAGKRAYIYRPDPPAGSKREIPVELQQIMKRKAADVTLLANDILYIPDNSGRRLTVSALEKIATFGTATASGILIWRR